jgi:hypothetical protein
MDSPGQCGRAPAFSSSAFAASEPTSPATGCHQGSFHSPHASSPSQMMKAERPRRWKARSAGGWLGRSPGVLQLCSMKPARDSATKARK